MGKKNDIKDTQFGENVHLNLIDVEYEPQGEQMVCLTQYWDNFFSLISSFLDYNCWGKPTSGSFRDLQVTDFSIPGCNWDHQKCASVPSLQSITTWGISCLEFSCFPSLLSCSNQILSNPTHSILCVTQHHMLSPLFVTKSRWYTIESEPWFFLVYLEKSF